MSGSSHEVRNTYLGLSVVQVVLLVVWVREGSWGAVAASVVGLAVMGLLYATYLRRTRLTKEYFDSVLAELDDDTVDG